MASYEGLRAVMKACPQCASTYSDRIEFCFHDGSALDDSAASTTGSSAAEPWDLPIPSPFDLPAPPPKTRQAVLTPTPLAPFALPLTQVSSPLPAPPPPPKNEPATPAPVEGVAPTPDAAVTRAPVSALTPTPSPEPRAATPPPPPVATDEPEDGEGGGAWIWWAGLGVGVVALLAAMLFAAGSLGLLGAATVSRKKPVVAVVEAEPSQAPVAEPDEERFPPAPLEVGVISGHADTDTDTDPGGDTDLAAQGEGSDGNAPPPTTPGTADPEVDRGGSTTPARADAPPAQPPAPAGTPPLVVGTVPTPPAGEADAPSATETAPAAEVDSPWGATPDAEPPPANAGTVLVFLQGDSTGLDLVVDGKLQRGTFPHTLQLAPGVHRFRVQDGNGKSYEIGKTISFDGDSAMRVMLISP